MSEANDARAAEVRGTVVRLAMVSVFASALNVVVSIARGKVTAVILGPHGLGQAAEISQVIATAFVPLSLIGGPALVTALARALTRPEGERSPAKQRIIDTVSTVVILAAVPLTVAVVAASWGLFPSWRSQAVLYTALAALGTLFGALTAGPVQLLIASGDMRRFASLSVVTSVLQGVATIVATWLWKLEGQFFARAAAPAVILFLSVGVARKNDPRLRFWPRWLVDRSFFKEALAVGTASVVAGFTLQGALSVFRWRVQLAGGGTARGQYLNGQFQAAWAMGATYFGVVLTGLGNAVFPRYAAAADPEALGHEIDAAVSFVLRFAPPLILAAIALRRWVIPLLYSREFGPAEHLLGLTMAGDLAKAVSWAYAGPLLFRGLVRPFLLSEGLGAALLAGGAYLLIGRIGLDGAGWAYLGAYLAYVLLTRTIVARVCAVRPSWRALVFVGGFTAVALGAVWATDQTGLGGLVAQTVVLGAAAIWGVRTGVVSAAIRRIKRKLGRAAPAEGAGAG